MLLRIKENRLEIIQISNMFGYSSIDEIEIIHITSIRTEQFNVICVENDYEQNSTIFPIVLKKSS